MTFLEAINSGKSMRRDVDGFHWYLLDENSEWWIVSEDGSEGEKHGECYFTRADFNATDWIVSTLPDPREGEV